MSNSSIENMHPVSGGYAHGGIEGDDSARLVKTRRIQDTLSIAGGAVIAFSAWTLLKVCLLLAFADADTWRQMSGVDDEATLSMVIVVSCVLLIVFPLVDLGIHVYVGLSARAEGRGEKRNAFYLVVALVVAVANAFSLFAIVGSTALAESPLNTAVSAIVEATALGALLLVIVSSLRLRRMNKGKA